MNSDDRALLQEEFAAAKFGDRTDSAAMLAWFLTHVERLEPEQVRVPVPGRQLVQPHHAGTGTPPKTKSDSHTPLALSVSEASPPPRGQGPRAHFRRGKIAC